MPYHPQPRRASSTNRHDWSPHAEVLKALRARPDFFSGIGFVFAANDPYTGIDFDNCLDETGAFCSAWAETWVRRLNSYTEISPSGRGVKVFVRGTAPAALKTTAVEVYSKDRYFTVTGRHLPGTPMSIRDVQETLDELLAEVGTKATPKPSDVGTTSEIEDADVAREIAGIGRLLGADRLPRRLTERSQARKVLADALAGWPNGAPDYSVMRFIVVKGLYLHGYPDAEIVALLWHYRPALNGGGKSVKNWSQDIARMIRKVKAEKPDVVQEPSRGEAKTADLEAPEPPQHSRARKDRPQPVRGADGYLAWLETQADANGVVQLSQSQAAKKLGCDVKTIKRYEQRLREQITRVVSDDRQHGFLKIAERGDNITNDAANVGANVCSDVGTTSAPFFTDAEQVLPQQGATNGVPESAFMSQCIGGTQYVCSSQVSEPVPTSASEPAPQPVVVQIFVPEPTRQRLDTLVSEGFDIYGEAPLHKRKRLVLRYVADNGGEQYEQGFVEAMYDAERDRRSMATWKTIRLRWKLRRYEELVDAARDGSGDKLWLWQRLSRFAREELARRPAEPGKKPRKNCEALPDLRRLREQREEEYRKVADREFGKIRAERGTTPCVPPPAVPIATPVVTYDARGMIARLRDRQALQPASATG